MQKYMVPSDLMGILCGFLSESSPGMLSFKVINSLGKIASLGL